MSDAAVNLSSTAPAELLRSTSTPTTTGVSSAATTPSSATADPLSSTQHSLAIFVVTIDGDDARSR
jgi:hypothetical protein